MSALGAAEKIMEVIDDHRYPAGKPEYEVTGRLRPCVMIGFAALPIG
jgi:hypothetical protein